MHRLRIVFAGEFEDLGPVTAIPPPSNTAPGG